MNIPKGQEEKKSFSFHIQSNLYSNTKLHLSWEDKLLGFEGNADLVIKKAPSFLTAALVNKKDKILVCQNVSFNKRPLYTNILEKQFIQLISKAMGELYKFSIFHHLQGVLIFFSSTEIDSLTELQKNWLKDFSELFSYIELSPKGFYQLYMPTIPDNFQKYCTLNALLEQNINSSK